MTQHARSPQRWFLWGLLALPYLVVQFHRVSMGVLQPDLVAAFGLSATAFANIGAAYFYVYAAMQIPAGILADTIGPRWTVSVSTLITATGTVLFAAASTPAMLFVARLVIGFGVSTIFIGILKVLAVLFDERSFASMTGLTSTVGNLGAVAAQAPLFFAAAAWGWRFPFFAVGAFTATAAVLCFLLIPADTTASTPDTESHILRELGVILRNWRTWPPWLVFTGLYGSFIALVGTWGQQFLVQYHRLDESTASSFLTTTVLAFAVGGFAIARASDLLARRRAPMIVATATVLVCWVLLVSGFQLPATLLQVVLVVLGFSSGVVLITLPCGKEVNNPRYSGTSTSVVNIGGFLGSAIIPVIMGVVLDAQAGGSAGGEAYRLAMFVCLAGTGLAMLGALFVTETHARNITSA